MILPRHENAIAANRRTELERRSPAPSHTPTESPTQREARYFRREMAAATIGTITKGLELYTITKGQFNFGDAVSHVAAQIGPASLDLATWTANPLDAAHLKSDQNAGRLTTIRFLLDFTYYRRHPDYWAGLRELYGLENIRTANVHAKFAAIIGPTMSVLIVTSANLNTNLRTENYIVREDPGLARFHADFIDAFFKARPADDSDKMKKWQQKQRFKTD